MVRECMLGGIPLHSITEVRGARIVKKGLSLKARRPRDLSVIAIAFGEAICIEPCELEWGAMVPPKDAGRGCDGVG